MHRNVFLKKKNEDKYNPDVLTNYEKSLENRKNENFKKKNTPYRLIIQDKVLSEVKNEKDFKLDTKENVDIKSRFHDLLENRIIQDNTNKKTFAQHKYNENQSNFNNRQNDINLISESDKDYNKLKKNRKEYYHDQQKTLSNEKERYNNILASLQKKGLIN